MAADDLGIHLVDLTRLLPLTLEELEDEGKRTGRWSTSFRLLGKARGATLSVSFTFSIIGGCLSVSGCGNVKVSEVLTNKPGKMGHFRSRSMEDVKVVHEVLPTMRSDVAELARADYADVNECQIGNSGGDLKPEFKVVCELGGSPDLKPCASGEFVDGENCKLQGMGITDEGKFSGTQPVREMVDNGRVIISETSADPDDQVELLSGIEQGIRIADEGKFSETESPNGVCEMIDNGCVAMDNESSKDPDEQVKLSSSGNGLGENCGLPRYTDPEKSGLTDLDSAQSCEEQEFSKFMLDCKLGSMVSRSLSLDVATEFEPSAKPDEEMLEFLGHDSSLTESSVSLRNSAMEDLDIAFSGLLIHELEGVESPQKEAKSCTEQGFRGFKTPCGRMGRSLGLNGDTAESVASEFLSMLGIEHSPFRLSSDSDSESPKEHLWKQFERDTLSIDNSIFGLDEGTGTVSGWDDFSEDFDLASIVLEAETGLEKTAQGVDSKSRAKMLEDAETEALMREWGLNEKAFQNSPPGSRGGFGSPINLPPEVPLDLPPLGEGLGPILQTKDGGFVRSMSPSLFKNAKNHESLIMQVSSPVVVPAEMGSGIMDILQCLASVGIEKLSRHAKKLMPLEDISGKTMQQVAWQVSPNVETCERQEFLQHPNPDACGRRKKARSSNIASCGVDTGSECVSLEDLAPLAMDQIEALSIEGLRVQSGMSDDDAPSSISPLSVGSMSALVGKESKNSECLGIEGATGLQLLNVNDYGDDVDGLMSLSLSLDEWMRLDSGIIDEDQISDRTSKILAAHHACSTDFLIGGSKEGKRGGKGSGRRWGLLGNNFTVALMVQLRNPLRNYEPVGTPMLSLIQVERAFVPPKPKIYNTVSEKGNSEQDEEPETSPELVVKEEMKDEEDAIPQFKVTEVHVAGLKTDPGNKKSWGNQMQQQSGSRWLLATGMGKRNKNPFTRSMTCGKPGDSLWSISSRADGTGSKWNVRNPDVWLC